MTVALPLQIATPLTATHEEFCPHDRKLTPGEAGHMFGVTAGTMARWAKAGRLSYTCTLGGQRRYPEGELRALLVRVSGSR
ncbi:hypothetical protein GCM10009733_020930 [Nonomuraea maheshkhaliensis]|uniref:Helix-turn-helix domain-containing protein n=1 Tax=Nonomuraea maheshkhaliensis TaxID=419590 RepID=A0ABN2EZN9_9ACTN